MKETGLPGGLICPIVTPLNSDGTLNTESFSRHIEWLAPQVDGLFVLGSTGELAALPDELIPQVVASASTVLQREVPLYVGVSDTGTTHVLRRIESLGARADFLVVSGPYYFQATSQNALVDHFVRVADRAPRPIILYNLPQIVGVAIQPSTVVELAKHPNIWGLKDSSGNMISFMEVLFSRLGRLSGYAG